MFIRPFCFLAALLIANAGHTQQSADSAGDASQELQLDLEKFSDKPSESKELELNLDQFTPSDPQVSDQVSDNGDGDLQLNLEQFNKKENTGNDLELNLDQFEKSKRSAESGAEQIQSQGESSKKINNTGSGATAIEQSNPTKYKYTQVFIVAGLVLLVVFFILSRRGRKRR